MKHIDDKQLNEIHNTMRSFRTRFLTLCFALLLSAITLTYISASDLERGGAIGLAIASIFYYSKYATARDISDALSAEITKRAKQPTPQ
jgi:hypothetical protein